MTTEITPTDKRHFPNMGPLPWLHEDPHAELGRLKIKGMNVKCSCGSAVWFGQGISSDGDLYVQCFNCRQECAFIR